jgi:hypothetical protein
MPKEIRSPKQVKPREAIKSGPKYLDAHARTAPEVSGRASKLQIGFRASDFFRASDLPTNDPRVPMEIAKNPFARISFLPN